MKAHVERCSGIIVKSSETPGMNFFTLSWSKGKHNELKLPSSPNAQNLVSMTENGGDSNARKKQKGHCDLS